MITEQHPRFRTVTVVRDDDGTRIGRIVAGGRTFSASRIAGQAGVDIRRYAYGFRKFDTALAWVGRADRPAGS